jgi:SPP1 family predicted phage head-tail adaptor
MAGLFIPGFEIWRAGRTEDGKGGWVDSFAVSSASVEGRLSPLSAARTPRAMQERGVLGLRFSTPFATDILADDQIRKGGRIVRVDAVTITSSNTRKECVCEEVT